MSKQLEKLIAECVIANVVFTGLVSSAYTVQDLIHSTNLDSIDRMGQNIQKRIETMKTNSFRKTRNTQAKRLLQLQYDTLAEIYDYKVDLDAKRAKRAKERKANVEKLANLRQAHTAVELKELGKLSSEDIAKQIKQLENA